jgi:hypothetical protein
LDTPDEIPEFERQPQYPEFLIQDVSSGAQRGKAAFTKGAIAPFMP